MGLDDLELTLEVERRFGISIPDREASQVRTIEDLFLVVLRCLTAAEAEPADLYCRDCGYNLRGCVSSECPECGLSFVTFEFKHDDESVIQAWKQLLDVISEQLGVSREKLKPTTRFIEDLRC